MSEIYNERFRPQYHFSAPKGWLNDPNGLIFHNHHYHMFYQHNPDAIRWSSPHWGHAVSDDMVHWNNLPIALFPDELGTIFSGTIVADSDNTSGLFDQKGGLVAVFTHHNSEKKEEYQSIAFSKDDGLTWEKYKGNPVLRGEGGPEWKDFRDPKVLRFNDQWLMIVGGGRYRFYTSDDLIHWKQMGDMVIFEEFPDLFQIGEQWVLNINGFSYYVGSMGARGFIPAQDAKKVEFANSWQACYTWENMPDRRCVWMAWMRDSAKGPTYAWRCNMSVPREITLQKKGDEYIILQNPVHELESLRERFLDVRNCKPVDINLSGIHGQHLDIEMEVRFEDESPFALRCFADDDQYVEIGCRPAENLIYVDTRSATSPEFRQYNTMFALNMSTIGNAESILCRLFSQYHKIGKTLKIRALLDGSTLEVFFDDGMAVATMNVYPGEASDELCLIGNHHEVKSLKVYNMQSIWR